ncbi:hypothetical protein QAD02_020954 [Eretmocerus hayati]|uniref:Uncharacterized protein n=1 Tax=Eretmocerus hayati TaxID=131215 RepID=A0ACC2PNT1_9HYME|nr:hypothetical protein QAD02_020954 [Eretmocerus hayati]
MWNDQILNYHVDMRPLPKEPESEDKRRKNPRNRTKIKEIKDKPNISYPTNFEHTVHVGFDAVTGEFTNWELNYLIAEVSRKMGPRLSLRGVQDLHFYEEIGSPSISRGVVDILWPSIQHHLTPQEIEEAKRMVIEDCSPNPENGKAGKMPRRKKHKLAFGKLRNILWKFP